MRTDPDAQAMQAALEALEESRDDVAECLAGLEHGRGWPSYTRRIAAYEEQLKKHDDAITALRERLADSAGAKAEMLLVPVEPSEEALAAAHDAFVGTSMLRGYAEWCERIKAAIKVLGTPPTQAVQAAVREVLEKVVGLCDENHDKHLIAAIRAIRPEDIKGE